VGGDAGEVVRQQLANNTDVDTAEQPDWEIYPHYDKLEVIREHIGILMGSRGCAYNCAYCCNLALIKQSKGTHSRINSEVLWKIT